MTATPLLASRYPQARLKFLVRLVTGGTPDISVPEYWADGSEGHLWVTIADMSAQDEIRTTRRRVSQLGLEAERLRLHPVGTLLMSMYATLGETATLLERGTWNQAILGLVGGEDIDRRYLRYCLEALRPLIGQLARSSTQPNLSLEQVGNIAVPLPSLDVQRAIAEKLDYTVSSIDGLIQTKRSLRTVLSEKREAVIFHGVRGLLDDSHDRHDLGLPWAHEIREPWPTAKIKHVAHLGTGHTPSRSRPEYWEDCKIPWITTGEIAQVRDDRVEVISETRERVSEIGLANSSAVLHPKGTVVLCRTASAGYSAIMGADMATSQDFVTWTCSERLRPRYLLMCLRAMRSDLQGRLAYGSTHKTIYMPDVERLVIPLPTIAEQDGALREIDEHVAVIDALTERIERQITLLEERRRALITVAVTGEITIDGNTREIERG